MGKRDDNRRAVQSAIYDAALALFDDAGFDETTVEEITARAGVGRATFFRHFDTKAGLLRVHNRRLVAVARGRLADVGPAPFGTRLRAVAGAIHDAWAPAGAGLRRLGLEAIAAGDPTGETTHPELLDLVEQLLDDAVGAGEVSLDVPPRLAAYLVTTHLVAAVGWWLGNPDADLAQLLDALMAQCLDGLGLDGAR